MNLSATGQAARSPAERPFVPPGLAFATIVAIWLAFGVALVGDPGGLVALWGTIQGLWLPLRASVWLFFLPWVLGLWAWQSDWSIWLRLAVVAGLAAATIAAFYPPRVAA
jgi:hypothetical protein